MTYEDGIFAHQKKIEGENLIFFSELFFFIFLTPQAHIFWIYRKKKPKKMYTLPKNKFNGAHIEIPKEVFKNQDKVLIRISESEKKIKELGWISRDDVSFNYKGDCIVPVSLISSEPTITEEDSMPEQPRDELPHIHFYPSTEELTTEICKAYEKVKAANNGMDIVSTRIEAIKNPIGTAKLFLQSDSHVKGTLCCHERISQLLLLSFILYENERHLFEWAKKGEKEILIQKIKLFDAFTLDNFVDSWIDASPTLTIKKIEKGDSLREFTRYNSYENVYVLPAIEYIELAARTLCQIESGEIFLTAFDIATTLIVDSYVDQIEFIYKNTKITDELCKVGEVFIPFRDFTDTSIPKKISFSPTRPPLDFDKLEDHIPPCHYQNYIDLIKNKRWNHAQRLVVGFYFDVGYTKDEILKSAFSYLEKGEPDKVKSRQKELETMAEKIEKNMQIEGKTKPASNSCATAIEPRQGFIDCKKCVWTKSVKDIEDLIIGKMGVSSGIVNPIIKRKATPLEKCNEFLEKKSMAKRGFDQLGQSWTRMFFTPYSYTKISIQEWQNSQKK